MSPDPGGADCGDDGGAVLSSLNLIFDKLGGFSNDRLQGCIRHSAVPVYRGWNGREFRFSCPVVFHNQIQKEYFRDNCTETIKANFCQSLRPFKKYEYS